MFVTGRPFIVYGRRFRELGIKFLTHDGLEVKIISVSFATGPVQTIRGLSLLPVHVVVQPV